jgi:cell volume regulation protein A
MDPLALNLIMIAGLFLLGAAGEMIFARTQVPDVVWLILAGVILNATGLVDPSALDDVLPLFAALTLIIILFEGGSKLVVQDLVKSAPRASILAIFSFILSTAVVTVMVMGGVAIGMLPESWGLMHGIMIGAMLGGSSSLIVMPSMELAKVEEKVANLVGLESALTDALCVVVTVAMIGILAPGGNGDASASATAAVLGKSFGIALAIGVASGWVWMPIMARMRGNPHAYPVTLAALLFLYVAVDQSGGSAALGILAFAVIVGNANTLMNLVGFRAADDGPVELDADLRTVHTQISFIIKSFFFTFIGLKLTPPWSLLMAGVVVGIGLLVARVPAVQTVARGSFTHKDRQLITVSLPRGMAAGVLATLPAQAGIEGTEDLPSMVFAAVVTSIAVFAFGFRKIRSGAAPAQANETDARAKPTEDATESATEGEASDAPSEGDTAEQVEDGEQAAPPALSEGDSPEAEAPQTPVFAEPAADETPSSSTLTGHAVVAEAEATSAPAEAPPPVAPASSEAEDPAQGTPA